MSQTPKLQRAEDHAMRYLRRLRMLQAPETFQALNLLGFNELIIIRCGRCSLNADENLR